MKNILFLTWTILIVAGCKQQPPTPSEDNEKMKSEENIALVKKYMTAYEAEDIETMKALSDDSLLILGPGHMDEIGYKVYYEKWVPLIFETEDSRHYDVIAMTHLSTPEKGIEGDWVLCWANFSYFHLDTQKTIQFPIHFAAMIKNGKIRIIARYYDQLDLYTQLGFKLTPLKE